MDKHPKHKYVHFEGGHSERKRLRTALRYEPMPYPEALIAGDQISGVSPNATRGGSGLHA